MTLQNPLVFVEWSLPSHTNWMKELCPWWKVNGLWVLGNWLHECFRLREPAWRGGGGGCSAFLVHLQCKSNQFKLKITTSWYILYWRDCSWVSSLVWLPVTLCLHCCHSRKTVKKYNKVAKVGTQNANSYANSAIANLQVSQVCQSAYCKSANFSP